MKKVITLLLIALLLTSCADSGQDNTGAVDEISDGNVVENVVTEDVEEERGKLVIETLEDIDVAIELMTLEEKAGQMIQAERGGIQLSEISAYNIGSVLSGGGSAPSENTPEGWITLYNRMQRVSRNSSSGIPLIYGIDAVHGHNNVADAVLFPHNIGLGAANNEDLMYQIGAAVGDEMNATGLNWNFSPAVSIVQDLRWGRSYEGFSEETSIVTNMGAAYVEGIQSKGVIATTKHFIGDGFTTYGTGEGTNVLDRGDVTVSMERLLEVYLPAYEKAIEAGTKSIMVSFNSVGGEKMHEHDYLLKDILRDQLGFEGVLISDWEAIHALPGDLKNQVALSINAGVDMLMQPYNWKDVYEHIIENVNEGIISEARIDEAVKRILVMKLEANLFIEDFEKEAQAFSTEEVKDVARQAVRESMVLLKNEGILPLKKDSKIYLTGPASDNVGVQSGGWSLSWQGEMQENLNGGTSLKDALELVLIENNGFLVDSPEEADLILLAIGEMPYAEMMGDTSSLALDGMKALSNMSTIRALEDANKPIVTLLISGRPMLVEDHIDDWDAFVMAWLPGTEGLGMTDVLFGDYDFTGKLPITWPKTNEQATASVIQEDYMPQEYQFEFGFGLNYSN